MRWLMRLFQRSHQPERDDISHAAASDPAFDRARQDYQAEKEAALQREAELRARVKRLGYDFDLTTGRARNERH